MPKKENQTELFIRLLSGRSCMQPVDEARQGLKDYHTAQAMKNALRRKELGPRMMGLRAALASYKVWVQIGSEGSIVLLGSDRKEIHRIEQK